jgi:hypothetical protein
VTKREAIKNLEELIDHADNADKIQVNNKKEKNEYDIGFYYGRLSGIKESLAITKGIEVLPYIGNTSDEEEWLEHAILFLEKMVQIIQLIPKAESKEAADELTQECAWLLGIAINKINTAIKMLKNRREENK